MFWQMCYVSVIFRLIYHSEYRQPPVGVAILSAGCRPGLGTGQVPWTLWVKAEVSMFAVGVERSPELKL